MESNKIIKFQNIDFYSHPIYNRYAASKEGQILGKKHEIILKQSLNKKCGYLYFKVFNENVGISYLVSRFVYECFKGKIPNDKVVDHIDNNKINNKIC